MAGNEVKVRARARPAKPTAPAPSKAVAAKPEPAQDVDVHEGTILVTRTVYGVEEEVRNERVRVPIFGTTPAKVRLSAGLTINLGDYNSARVEAAIEMPCYPIIEETRRTYSILSREIEEIIRNEVSVVRTGALHK